MISSVLDRLLVAALCVLACCGWETLAQKPPPEYEVKAAFLYNFIKYTEWPQKAFPTADTALTIGVLGTDPFRNLLDKAVEGKTFNGRKLIVRRFDQNQNFKTCHLLFISSSESGRLSQLLADLRGLSILTVSETEKFAERGGIINFKMIGEKVRFEINNKAAESAGLRISSKLLNVATVISTEPR
jgi:hypothetical protein